MLVPVMAEVNKYVIEFSTQKSVISDSETSLCFCPVSARSILFPMTIFCILPPVRLLTYSFQSLRCWKVFRSVMSNMMITPWHLR